MRVNCEFEAVHSAELSGVLRIRHSLQQIPQPALWWWETQQLRTGLKSTFSSRKSRCQVQIRTDTNMARASSYKFLLSFHQMVCFVFLSKCLAVTRPTTDNHFSWRINSNNHVPGEFCGGCSLPRVNYTRKKKKKSFAFNIFFFFLIIKGLAALVKWSDLGTASDSCSYPPWLSITWDPAELRDGFQRPPQKGWPHDRSAKTISGFQFSFFCVLIYAPCWVYYFILLKP